MSELKVITTLAEALSKAYAADIMRLDIQFNNKTDCYTGYLLLGDNSLFEVFGEYSICDDGTVARVSTNKSSFLKGSPNPTPEVKKLIDELKETDPEAEGTVSEAMEGMKAAVDSLEVPKKPKNPAGGAKKRPKDRHERILKLYNQGYTKVKMAEELGIGTSTINYHIQKLRDEGKI